MGNICVVFWFIFQGWSTWQNKIACGCCTSKKGIPDSSLTSKVLNNLSQCTFTTSFPPWPPAYSGMPCCRHKGLFIISLTFLNFTIFLCLVILSPLLQDQNTTYLQGQRLSQSPLPGESTFPYPAVCYFVSVSPQYSPMLLSMLTILLFCLSTPCFQGCGPCLTHLCMITMSSM